jgi:hypothetical protein
VCHGFLNGIPNPDCSGQPLRPIQKFLGHADAKMTQICAHAGRLGHGEEMEDTETGLRSLCGKR